MSLKKLFGVNYWPKLDLERNQVSLAAQKMAGKLSISGVQAKLPLKLNRKNKKLEVAARGDLILKPQIDTFPYIPENENLCMNIADNLGIEVPPHALIRLKDNNLAYIVRRFDRDSRFLNPPALTFSSYSKEYYSFLLLATETRI